MGARKIIDRQDGVCRVDSLAQHRGYGWFLAARYADGLLGEAPDGDLRE